MSSRRAIGVLVTSNLLGGVGVASGVAVGGLLAEDLGGTAFAGLGQAASVLGAGLAAMPLATLARTHGRRWALTIGYLGSLAGAVGVIGASMLRSLPLLLVSLALFGVATATNLQSRYAAADYAAGPTRARTMSIVIWATTVGAVAGPNLTAPGSDLGLGLGLSRLAGPYLFSIASFTLGAVLIALVFPSAPGHAAAVTPRQVKAAVALRWALARPQTRWAVLLIASAHAVMVMVMVMTPVYMQHDGMSLELVGVVISLHVLGMYGLSPIFGSLADTFGPARVAWLGMALQLVATVLGLLAVGRGGALTAFALTVLGTGWSACIISASAVLAAIEDDGVRISLQGATDAAMNFAGAGAAALAGPILALGGFTAVNIAAMLILVPVALVALHAGRQRGTEPAPTTIPTSLS